MFNTVNSDLLFEFPLYKLELNLTGIEKDLDDTKITVVDNGCMLRFKDLDCLLYNANLHLRKVYEKKAEELYDLNYKMRISDPKGNVIFQEETALIGDDKKFKVLICNDNKTKALICRVLFKDVTHTSIKGRTWDYAQKPETK